MLIIVGTASLGISLFTGVSTIIWYFSSYVISCRISVPPTDSNQITYILYFVFPLVCHKSYKVTSGHMEPGSGTMPFCANMIS